MRKKLLLLCLTLIASIAFLASCGNGHGPNDLLQTSLNAMLAENWSAYAATQPGIQGGIAIYIISPKGNYYASANMPEGSKDAHFRAASTTKTYTAAAIMLLSQQGLLNIDDLITATIPGSSETYLPNTPEYAIRYKNTITIKMLLMHTAGVWDIVNDAIPTTEAVPYAGQIYLDFVKASEPAHQFSFAELVSADATCQLANFAPGGGFYYTNLGYDLLANIVERVSGKRYDQFVHDNFLLPNGLSETTFPYTGTLAFPPLPYEIGHNYQNHASTLMPEDNVSGNVGEGNVITTPAELATWMRLLVKGQAGLTLATVNQMTMEAAGAVGHYGLGLFPVPGLGWGHNGAHPGYQTFAFYDPTQDVSMVVSVTDLNYDDQNVSQTLCIVHSAWAAKNILGYSTLEAF